MVLLAGLGDTVQIYRGLASRLSSEFKVVGLTRRGHGRSDKPENEFNLETLVDDIRNFLDHLGIQRPILVGHSFGGIEIYHFSKHNPQRVDAIVLLDALFPKLDPQPDLSGDPVWAVISTDGPKSSDLVSRQAYLEYYKRVKPVLARLWCESIEADLLDKTTLNDNGYIEFHHDDALMN
ncbi:MAG TPA: alpha/beta fold hydrolase [Anaerolineales bacterium]|nr:alpha/beta fold hydrolase [Anaerolineales bacterium]